MVGCAGCYLLFCLSGGTLAMSQDEPANGSTCSSSQKHDADCIHYSSRLPKKR